MTDTASQPAIILVRPQLGENIGKAARAMLNFGLTEMRLVAPRDGWPNPEAGPSASGADGVLDRARVFDQIEDAIADCTRVLATTVRDREMAKPVITAVEAAAIAREVGPSAGRVGILFGPERAGLTNDDVALADTILTVPVNPAFGSLNLAQAVIIVAYEWFRAADATPAVQAAHPEGPAPKADLIGLMEHLEGDLDARGFFRSAGRKPSQIRSLRTILQNAHLSEQDVRTLRGVIKALTRPVGKDKP